MRLLRLYIHGCGVFQNTLIDFTHKGQPQNLLCLAGVNGSGKTTIMELILNLVNFINPKLSFKDIYFDRLKSNILTRTNFAQLDILINDKILSLVLGDETNIQKDNNYDQAFIIESEIKKKIAFFENNVVKTPEDEDESIIIKKIQLQNIQESTELLNRNLKKYNLEIFNLFFENINEALMENNVLRSNNNLPFIYAFNANDREILDIRYNSIPKAQQNYKISDRYHPRQDDLKKTLIYYDYAYPDQFIELKKWVNQYILEGKNLERIDRVNFQVIIKTKDDKEHNIELLSSGEESLLIIATQLFLKASENAIFLIDEIDQSLHPEFQEKVMKLLTQLQKDKNCQIIVSSHSDIIWNNFKNQGLIDLTETVL